MNIFLRFFFIISISFNLLAEEGSTSIRLSPLQAKDLLRKVCQLEGCDYSITKDHHTYYFGVNSTTSFLWEKHEAGERPTEIKTEEGWEERSKCEYASVSQPYQLIHLTWDEPPSPEDQHRRPFIYAILDKLTKVAAGIYQRLSQEDLIDLSLALEIEYENLFVHIKSSEEFCSYLLKVIKKKRGLGKKYDDLAWIDECSPEKASRILRDLLAQYGVYMGLRTKDDPSLITYSRVYETLDAIRNDLILYGQVYWEDPNEPEEDTYWYNLWRRLLKRALGF